MFSTGPFVTDNFQGTEKATLLLIQIETILSSRFDVFHCIGLFQTVTWAVFAFITIQLIDT